MNAGISHSDPNNDYELLQNVGRGSFGEVYKARDLRTNQLAAIKIIKLEPGDNFAVIQQEITVLSECKHSNIISYYASYIKKDKLWIVMEYCSGGSLQDIYHMVGPLLELQIAFVCRETLKGLRYLHQQGKIHRDIKGANILLTHNGDVKLADFGVAAQITATLGKRKSFIGTPYWMAPEVAAVEKRGGYSTECDVWAVGITAIELAELQPPLFELQPMQMLYLMTKSNYKSPKLKDKQKWSSTMHDFVKYCLTKNPKKRPSPDKLLTSHAFVKGALSSRLTRELLDKINNLGRPTPRDNSSSPIEDGSLHLSSDLNSENIIEGSEYLRKPSLESKSSEEESIIKYQKKKHFYVNERINQSKSSPNGFTDNSAPITCVGTLKSITSDVISETSAISAPPIPMMKKKFRFDDVFKIPASTLKLKSRRSLSFSSISLKSTNSSDIKIRKSEKDLLPERPITFFGLPPTPKVPLGACFTSIFHDSNLKINSAATWINNMNNKQYAIIGADEGIYLLNLNELHENELILIYATKCMWLYIKDDILISLQGKIPYIYQHDLKQLIEQELYITKISKKMNKVPEIMKPKSLSASTRLPETKGCIQCTIQYSVTNNNLLYLCCSVSDAMVLYQWYDPLKKFMLIKRQEMDRFNNAIMKPFSLIFGNGPSNCDLPQLCYGIYKKQNDEVYDMQLINFNDHGKLEDFLINSSDDFIETLKPFTDRKLKFDNNLKLDISTMIQLEKDTIMMSYDNTIVFIGVDGYIKKPELMKTVFNFDFHIEYSVALSDSVLAFHRNGVQGKSFIDGSKTQDLNDNTKVYDVLCHEPVIILCSKPESVANVLNEERYSNAPTITYDSKKIEEEQENDSTLKPNTILDKTLIPPSKQGVDLCVLTGHVSTMD